MKHSRRRQSLCQLLVRIRPRHKSRSIASGTRRMTGYLQVSEQRGRLIIFPHSTWGGGETRKCCSPTISSTITRHSQQLRRREPALRSGRRTYFIAMDITRWNAGPRSCISDWRPRARCATTAWKRHIPRRLPKAALCPQLGNAAQFPPSNLMWWNLAVRIMVRHTRGPWRPWSVAYGECGCEIGEVVLWDGGFLFTVSR